MHCELAVPGLFAGATEARAPALELLLARGRPAAAVSRPLEGWLQHEFGLGGQPLAAGALTLLAAGAPPGDACWMRADPLHLRLMRDRLIVVPGAAFPLAREEAEALAEALNRHFSGVLSLRVIDAQRWCARLEEDLAFDAPNALEVAGRDVDLTARLGGAAGKRWSGLLNEAQMLLHAHPVNQARLAAALAPLKAADWPHRGALGVVETDRERDATEVHVVDRWCYLGTAQCDADVAELLEGGRRARFDYDHYRILARHLAKRGVRTRPLPACTSS